MNLVKVRQLYRPKESGWVAHNGLELMFVDGSRKVFHNSPVVGPTICSYEEFAEDQPVTAKQEITMHLNEVAQRISSLLQQKLRYHPSDFNCEHAVSWALEGVRKSPQLRATLGTSALAAGITMLMGGNAKQIAAAAAIGAGTGLLVSKSQLLSN